MQNLWENAKESQRTVMQSQRILDKELAESVWQSTLTEVESGLIHGPLTPTEIAARVGPRWVAARRFGIRQGEKIRPIDNFAEFGVNDAFGSSEKVALLSVDHIVSWSRARLECCNEDRKVRLVDNAGTEWNGQLHDSWSVEDWRSIQGRVADLQNAYKQLAVHPSCQSFSVIAAQDPSSGIVKLFEAWALMFGETAAVYGFLRISRALSTIASRIFDLMIVEFFDDFTQIENSALTESALETMEGMADSILTFTKFPTPS